MKFRDKKDVFISYRRDGGEYTAKIIRDRLTELGYNVFFDVETLRNGDFNTMLYTEIDECRDFILILSPGALDRCVNDDDWVRREVEYALSRGKNIVPILLRGFSFPDTLPPSLQPLVYKNGIEANSQFFDAFIQKLQQFLLTKPDIFQKIRQSSLLHKMLPVLLALLVLLGAGAGGTAIYNSVNRQYPRTAAEKDLTEEALYHTGLALVQYDLLAGAKLDALDAAERYLSTGAAETADLDDAFAVSRNTVENTVAAADAPPELFLQQLADSPFSSAEFAAMHDGLIAFQQECRNDLDYIRRLVSPEFLLSDSDKLRTIDLYRSMLQDTLQYYAYAANQMLLPITDETALEDFWGTTLPALRHIPLRSVDWKDEFDGLEQAMDECFHRMETASAELGSIVGKSNLAAAQQEETLIQQYESLGYSRADAEAITELVKQGYTDGQAEYVFVFSAMGYTTEQALQIYNYAEKSGYSVAAAQKLVDHESRTADERLAEATAYYKEQGLSDTEAAEAAAKYADNESLKYKARLALGATSHMSEDELWNAFLSMKNCLMYEDANDALDFLFNRLSATDEHAADYISSARMFLAQIDETGIDYGVLVTSYTEEGHEVLRVGDIIIAFDGMECRGADSYRLYKDRLTQKEYTVTVLRPENGAFQQLELALTTDMPLIGISSLTK